MVSTNFHARVLCALFLPLFAVACGDEATDKCDNGFSKSADGKCVDVDECAAGTDNCGTNGTCANTAGGFTCACNQYYSGDGVTCSDVDECATNNGDCGAASAWTCSNNVGAVPTCTDINECTANTDNCDPHATCTNTTGGFTCACNTGYDGNGTDCVDEDGCADNPCDDAGDTGATCADVAAPATGFTCTCSSHFENATCTDINECLTNNGDCDINATCSNTTGSSTCTCNQYYSGNGTTCSDVDECATNNGDCGAASAWTCSNNVGEAPTCTDINECIVETDDCDTNATCANTIGGYTCVCNDGYAGSGTACADVDECTDNTDNCDVNATCANTSPPQEFTCTCNQYWQGDGVTCTDVDECASDNGDCGDAVDWQCANNIGTAPTCTPIIRISGVINDLPNSNYNGSSVVVRVYGAADEILDPIYEQVISVSGFGPLEDEPYEFVVEDGTYYVRAFRDANDDGLPQLPFETQSAGLEVVVSGASALNQNLVLQC